MKKLITLLLTVLLALTVFGCSNNGGGEQGGNESDEPIKICFWHTLTDQHLENLNAMIEGFNNSQDKIIVEAIQKPYADYDSNLLMAVANGNGPDFVGRYATDAVEYLADDLIVDMTPYVEEAYGSMDAWRDMMSGDVYKEATQLGGAYLFPTCGSSQVLFYNKVVFDELGLEVPKTWDDLMACAEAIHAAHPEMIPFTTDDELDDFQDIMTQKGFDYIDMDKKEIAWPKEETTKLLQWYVDKANAGLFQLKELGNYCSNDYAAGKTGMYIGSSAGASYACWGNEWDAIAPLPQAGTYKYIPNWGGGYVIFKTTEEKQKACFEFLKYFAQPEVVADYAAKFGSAPCYKAAYDTDIYKEYAANDMAAKAMGEQQDCMSWLRACIGSEQVRTEIQKMMRTAINGEATVEQAVETFYASCNAALKG